VIMQEFEVYLVSNGSMHIFPHNTLSAFTNLLAEPLSLEGEWRVALSEITTSPSVKNIVDTRFEGYTQRIIPETQDTVPVRSFHELDGGVYRNVDEILATLQDLTNVSLEWGVHPTNGKLSITFQSREGFSFPNREIPDILGFIGRKDTFGTSQSGVHIGYKQMYASDNSEQFTLHGDYSVDITAGRHVMFVYINIIEYQTVADTKAPLLRMLPVETRMRNGSIVEVGTLNHRSFKDLQFKSLLSNNIQSINIELRNDNGDLIPFVGNGRTVLTLKFQKVS
jgi:hypothetical protein